MSLTALASAADNAILAARQDNSIISGTSEPNQVARLVTSLPKLLVNAWQPFVKKGALTVSAAFCHAKPHVKWESPLAGNPSRSPELADLLFIFDVANPDGSRARRSLLIQAKKSISATCTLSTDGDLTQRYMFAHWPDMSLMGVPSSFTVPDPLLLGPVGADIQARYACFDIDPLFSTPAWTLEDSAAGIPASTGLASFAGPVHLSLGTSLGAGLAELYAGTLGRACDVAGDQWSALTDYLERYVSSYVPSSALKDFPSVSLVAGATPTPLVAATSFFAAYPIDFPRYSKAQHLICGLDDWVDMHKVKPLHDGGLFYDWPPHNSVPPDQAQNLDRPGFGVIRVAIDQPFAGDFGNEIPGQPPGGRLSAGR